MSYCRWSTDDFRSDVYVFEHCDGGYTTMIAERRYTEAWYQATAAGEETCTISGTDEQNAERDRRFLEPLGLPLAGKEFNDATIPECIARLERLRDDGYRVPPIVFERLRRDMKDGAL